MHFGLQVHCQLCDVNYSLLHLSVVWSEMSTDMHGSEVRVVLYFASFSAAIPYSRSGYQVYMSYWNLLNHSGDI